MMLHTSNEPIVKPLLHFPFGAALLEKKLGKMAAEGYELVDCSGIMNLYTLTYRKGEPKEQRYLVYDLADRHRAHSGNPTACDLAKDEIAPYCEDVYEPHDLMLIGKWKAGAPEDLMHELRGIRRKRTYTYYMQFAIFLFLVPALLLFVAWIFSNTYTGEQAFIFFEAAALYCFIAAQICRLT